MIYAVSFKHSVPEDVIVLNVTSRSSTWTRAFSPFNVGPVELYGDYWAYNLENGYQFAKVYPEYLDCDGNPSKHYFEWAKRGWLTQKAIKYPMGAWSKHAYHWWDGKKLSHLEAQNQIFVPIYKKAMEKSSAFHRLKDMYEASDKDIYLVDFEGYNHRLLEQTWEQVLNNPDRPVGQGFVLCMLLEGYL
jgi:hypothetical protein